MNFLKNSLLLGALLALSISSFAGMAQELDDPFVKIDKISQQLITIINLHQKDFPSNEKQYFKALSSLLDDSVDFNHISNKVMGLYRAKATTTQKKLFAKKFRQGLVETYGRGLINYGDQKIVLENRVPLKEGQRFLVVSQEIRSSDNTFSLKYSMARKKTGEWMVINMNISGINLREIFRNQFSQAAQKSSGNLDVVIAGWISKID